MQTYSGHSHGINAFRNSFMHRKNNPFFRDASQSVTRLSASLHSRGCIFEQEKSGKEARNERFFSAAEAGWPLQQPLTTTN